MAQAEQIRDEGARYNLGNMRSTIGNPVMALAVLQRSYQPRFRFSLGKEDRGVGAGVWIVDYKEETPPAMIRGEAGTNLFAHGRLWIEAISGRVVKTELRVEQPAIRAVVTTTFRPDERFDIGVPLEMRESLRARATATTSTTSPPTAVSAGSTCSAEEEIHSPRPTLRGSHRPA